MPKFRVIHYYTSAVVYEVNADTEDAACAIVNGIDPPDPVTETGLDFADEMVENIDDEK